MSLKRIIPAVVFLLLITPTVFAQTKTYSLMDVWQNVLQNYRALTAKKEVVAAQELRKELISESFLPDVAVQAQQSYGFVQNTPGSFFSLPGLYNTSGPNKTTAEKSARSDLYSSALLQWNFMQFGRQQKMLSVADAAINVSNTLLKQEEWNLLSVATRLYFSALATTAALDVAKADTRRFSELLELLQAQAASGLRPGAHILLLKASLPMDKSAKALRLPFKTPRNLALW